MKRSLLLALFPLSTAAIAQSFTGAVATAGTLQAAFGPQL
jgi:hypothetical protein